jgi:CheY-like chemotaxis protein
VLDGRQAIQCLENSRFDLVITDLRMPGVDGFAILGWIKDFQPALLPRVLVITGDSGGATLDQQLIDLGVPAIRKPFTPEELITQCRTTLTAS